MRTLKLILGVVLALFSAFVLFDGVLTYLGTIGTVQGSEFGMLITLLNKLGLMMVWAALFAFWRVVPGEKA